MASVEAMALLERAARARDAGDAGATRLHLVAAFRVARAEGDVGSMASAALSLTSVQGFGTHPGPVPAYLHEALLATDDPTTRARLVIGLARAWAYGGEQARAAAFAREAQDLARETADPEVTADALDTALLAAWGPDDFAERVRLAARIEEASAHLIDPERRLTAHVWRLTTAWECLDVLAVRRQLRALDLLAEETDSPRVAFYALSRRAMAELVAGDLAAAVELCDRLEQVGGGLAEVDVYPVVQTLRSECLLLAGDHEALAAQCAGAVEFAHAEGVVSVLAQAAFLWWHAGRPQDAERTLDQLPDLTSLPDDVDTLLTVTCAAHAAAHLGRTDVAAVAATLLEPYAGRAVINAAAVSFHGVVDDALARVAEVLGDDAAARTWRQSASTAYQRLGATWWHQQLTGERRPPGRVPQPTAILLRQDGDTWSVGRADATFALPDLRGLHHLRHLLARPGLEVPAVELVEAAEGHPAEGVRQPEIPVLDEQAKHAYRKRLADLDEELDEAHGWADQGRVDAATRERELLLHELSRAVGLGGRDRLAGATSERARSAVRKAIAAALTRIEERDPALGRMLRDVVHTGTSCTFDPDPGRPVSWVLD